jgi:uncharacterized coiled-coil protein SlyX
MTNLLKVFIIGALVIIIILLALSMLRSCQPPPDNSNLEPRVEALEKWQAVAEQQLSDNEASITELNDSQKEDSMQLEALNADVAYLLDQLNIIKNKEINLHIDTTWIMGDSISIIGFKDSIHVRTKKQ